MDFKKERESLVAQRDNAYAVYQQTIGAIALLDALIQEEEEKGKDHEEEKKKDSITQEELEQLIGGKVVSIDEVKKPQVE